jgi:hypothetical protein
VDYGLLAKRISFDRVSTWLTSQANKNEWTRQAGCVTETGKMKLV